MNKTRITIQADDLASQLVETGEYLAKVVSVEIRRDGLIDTRFRIFDPEDENVVLTNVGIKFDPKKPIKIREFLKASGQKLIVNKPFNPAMWKGKYCLVGVDRFVTEDENGRETERNFIAGFLYDEPKAESSEGTNKSEGTDAGQVK